MTSLPRPPEHQIIFTPEFALAQDDYLWFFYILTLFVLVTLVLALIVNKYFKKKFLKISSYVISGTLFQYFAKFILKSFDSVFAHDLGFPFKIIYWFWDFSFYIVGLILNIIIITIFYFIADKLVQSYLRGRIYVNSQNNSNESNTTQ